MGIEYSFEYSVPLSELGVWNDHIYSPSADKGGIREALFKSLVQLIDKMSFSDDLNKALRFGFFKVSGVKYGVPHLIPPQYLRFFPVPEINFKMENLFGLMQKNGVRLFKKEPKLNCFEARLIKSVPKLLNDYDVILLKLNSLDRLGHKVGPQSRAVKKRITYLDGLIRSLESTLSKDVDLIVMSDHGMVPVKSTFDAIGFLKEKGFNLGKEYLGYVGATYISFWFKNSFVKNAIVRALNDLGKGHFLSQYDKQSLNIDSPDKRFGEEIFVINEYCVIFPEFYHARNPPKGMHGYATNYHDKPIFMLRTKKTEIIPRNEIAFIDLAPTILSLLGIPVPKQFKGISLFGQF